MGDHIDTRDGWREVDYTESVNGRVHLDEYDDSGHVQHRWLREEPVPPLPTTPYTVIRATWKRGSRAGMGDVLTKLPNSDRWVDWGGQNTNDVADRITEFVVLSEPRAVTAKAVLDRARDISVTYHRASGQGVEEFMKHLDVVAGEFGVEL